jgi:hypothetical protein
MKILDDNLGQEINDVNNNSPDIHSIDLEHLKSLEVENSRMAHQIQELSEDNSHLKKTLLETQQQLESTKNKELEDIQNFAKLFKDWQSKMVETMDLLVFEIDLKLGYTSKNLQSLPSKVESAKIAFLELQHKNLKLEKDMAMAAEDPSIWKTKCKETAETLKIIQEVCDARKQCLDQIKENQQLKCSLAKMKKNSKLKRKI